MDFSLLVRGRRYEGVPVEAIEMQQLRHDEPVEQGLLEVQNSERVRLTRIKVQNSEALAVR